MKFFQKSFENLSTALEYPNKVRSLPIRIANNNFIESMLQIQKLKNLNELFVESEYNPDTTGLIDKLELPKLKKLYLLNINFKEFPNWILDLSNLEKLMLRGNDISIIPKEIHRLNKLRTLRIENSNVEFLPKEIIHLNKLKKISLVDNFKLKSLNHEFFPKCLEIIRVSPSSLSKRQIDEVKSNMDGLIWNSFFD